MNWKPLKSFENLVGLNGLDVASSRYKEYMELVHGIAGSPDNKLSKDIERLGLKPGVAITLNPSPMPPLDSELKYANAHGLKLEKCDDGYYRWFKLA